MDKLVVEVGRQLDGCTFRLSPRTRTGLEDKLSNMPPATGIFIEIDTSDSFAQIHGPMWEQILSLLTGLSLFEIEKLGAYEFVDPVTRDVIYRHKDISASSHV